MTREWTLYRMLEDSYRICVASGRVKRESPCISTVLFASW